MKADHESLTSHGSSGIAFTDEESIIAHLDNFCNHIRSMIDIIHTLSQFAKLANDVRNLPRVQRDVVINSISLDEDPLGGDPHLKIMTGDVSGTQARGASVASGSEYSYPAEGIILLVYWDMFNFKVKNQFTCVPAIFSQVTVYVHVHAPGFHVLFN